MSFWASQVEPWWNTNLEEIDTLVETVLNPSAKLTAELLKEDCLRRMKRNYNLGKSDAALESKLLKFLKLSETAIFADIEHIFTSDDVDACRNLNLDPVDLLDFALLHNSIECGKYLITKIDCNQINANKQILLHRLIIYNSELSSLLLDKVLKQTKNPTQLDILHRNAMHYCRNKEFIVKLLPIQGWNTRDIYGYSPADYFILKKIENNLSLIYSIEDTVAVAIRAGDQEAVANFLYHEPIDFWTRMVSISLDCGNEKMANMIIKNKPLCCIPEFLARAAQNSYEELCQTLIDLNVNQVKFDGLYPFDWAVFHGNFLLATKLKRIVNYEKSTKRNNTIIVQDPRKTHLVEIMLNLKSDVDLEGLFLSIRVTEGKQVRFLQKLYADSVQNFRFQFDCDQFEKIRVFYEIGYNAKSFVTRYHSVLSLHYPGVSLWQEKTNIGGKYTIPIIAIDGSSSGLIESQVVISKSYGKVGNDMVFNNKKPLLVGHRGSGMNQQLKSLNSLQLGENTIDSFNNAIINGAEFIEFDVQLTKDHVPVIYHNFRTWETKESLSKTNYEDFMSWNNSLFMARLGRKRHSTTQLNSESYTKIIPNGQGTIQCPRTTLEEVFKKTNEVGFNIEVKYANLQQSEKLELENVEINTFVDKILDVVFKYAGKRRVYFSSFHADVITLLTAKQNVYPVFFLTDAGVNGPQSDARHSCLFEAVKHAKKTNCLGIVSNAQALVSAPNLVPYIQEQGLLLYTYGVNNNDIEQVSIQVEAGIDGIITDDLRLNRKYMMSLQ